MPGGETPNRTSPRREGHHYTRVHDLRGYTVKAGRKTRQRLQRGRAGGHREKRED